MVPDPSDVMREHMKRQAQGILDLEAPREAESRMST